MAIHVLQEVQVINSSLEKCWKFFSSASNLDKITPPNLGFEIASKLPEEVYPGLMIQYRVKPLLGISVTWVTEISHVRAPHYFCDEQRVGPYRMWHHEHFFRDLGGSRVEVTDRVHYQLPFSPFSEIVHPWLVSPRLQEIFDYRRKRMADFFP